MSPKIPLVNAGLAALGLVVGPAATVMLAVAGTPTTSPRAASPAAPKAPSAAAPSSERGLSVLLLSDGRVIRGKVTRDDSGYLLRTKVGEIHFARRQVEFACATMREAYDHKLAETAERDADERMKLARWCLDNGLPVEAKLELEAVLDLNPGSRRARDMLFQMEAVADRASPRDAGIVRAGAEVEMPADAPRPEAAPPADPGAPGVLDLNKIREEYRRNPRAGGVPVIFDLPPAQAVPRYQQFAQRVHPILQKHCAGCHNERTPGAFQLIQAQTRRDLANDLIARANLDATLRLVDRDDLGRSTLLTTGLQPHKPKNQPIFLGSNQVAYRELADWVQGLKTIPSAAAPGSGVRPASFDAPASAKGPNEGFAVDRAGGPPAPAAEDARTPSRSASAPRPAPTPRPAGLLAPGSEVGMPTVDGSATFPTSPLQGGPDAARVEIRNRKPEPEAPPADEAEGDTIDVPGIGKVKVDTRADPRKTPRLDKPTGKAAKPKINRQALESLMQKRNTPTP